MPSTQEHCGVVMQHANDGHMTQSVHCIEKQAYEEIMRISKGRKGGKCIVRWRDDETAVRRAILRILRWIAVTTVAARERRGP